MRYRISLLLAAVLAGTTFVLLGPVRPASAVVACGGNGTIRITPGLSYPVLLGVVGQYGKDHVVDILIGKLNIAHAFFFLAGPLAACVHVADPPNIFSAEAFGVFKGYCGHSSGFGTLSGQAFSYVSAGTFLVLTGHVIGVAIATPAPATGSCLQVEGPPQATGVNPFGLTYERATVFILTGAGVGLNCANALPPQELLTRLVDQDVLVTSLLGVHVHLGVHFWTTTPPCVPNLL